MVIPVAKPLIAEFAKKLLENAENSSNE